MIYSVITVVFIIDREINNAKNKIEVNLGKKVVMENDTLLIIDYSFYESTYTLSNGKIVSIKLVEKLQFIN
jgi:hypothetical protein